MYVKRSGLLFPDLGHPPIVVWGSLRDTANVPPPENAIITVGKGVNGRLKNRDYNFRIDRGRGAASGPVIECNSRSRDEMSR